MIMGMTQQEKATNVHFCRTIRSNNCAARANASSRPRSKMKARHSNVHGRHATMN